MEIQEKKLELIEMLLKTDKVSVLKKIKNLLLEEQENEGLVHVDYDMIETRKQAHLNEESASYSWEEVREKVRSIKL